MIRPNSPAVLIVLAMLAVGCRGVFDPNLDTSDGTGADTSTTGETTSADLCPDAAEVEVAGQCMGVVAQIEGSVGPRDLALAEMSGDTVLDLLVADTESVAFHLGGGGGSFGGAVPLQNLAGVGLAVGDLDGMDPLDFVVVGGSEAQVRFSAGGGSFTTGDTLSISQAWDALVIDLDNDGDQDLVASAAGVHSFSNEGGSFTELGLAPLAGTQGLAAADFDGDGHIDLAVAQTASNQVAVFRNMGDGNFAVQTMFSVSLVYDVATLDINGDGAAEILAVDSNDGNVAVLSVTQAFLVEQVSLHAVGRVPHRIAVGDVDGDGHMDVVTANNESGDASILLGDGTSLGDEIRLPTVVELSDAEAVAVADVDGDAAAEILVSGSAGKIVMFGFTG